MQLPADPFPPTQWSLLQKVRNAPPEEAMAALEALCRAYWHPLYCVARRMPLSEPDAQDAVQGFFQSILQRQTLSTADEAHGKLRQLLLRAFGNYCGQQREKATRLKRGGTSLHVELTDHLDFSSAEARYQKVAAQTASIESLYNREWAVSILERSLHALRLDYERRGWQDRYTLLVGALLQEEQNASLNDLAATSGSTPGALRVALHRMRGHYRDQIERELAITLGTEDPSLIREEMADLFRAFAE